MKAISDSDYKTILDCLADYIMTPSCNLRDFNRRRRARLILKKHREKKK